MKKPLIKYCGNSSQEDLEASVSSNADYLGLIFADSKRRVEPENVQKWLENIELGRKKLAAVFVNPALSEVKEVISKLPISVIQCHGDEEPAFLVKLKEETGLEVWKAISSHEDVLKEMDRFQCAADGFVVDSKTKEAYGGTGKTFDWSIVREVTDHAGKNNKKCFIAGGLSPENVSELMKRGPEGLDLASGIEDKGRKSKDKIKLFEEKVMNHDTTA
ncbi:phosphoribosylanthranilate isomerase [Metabacillus sp. RGM 3146]|uniref:phosphoribosylanthranilate isomerase n=1 Tax=Metabacillus sp. RGM 3146 TaxID=3401092 RepID=UPI003B9D88EB